MVTPQKVKLFLKNVGGAPLLQERIVTINEDEQVYKVIRFIQANLEGKRHEPVFVYVKSSFTPSPDEKIGVLADAFGSIEAGQKKLTLHYSLTPAWG